MTTENKVTIGVIVFMLLSFAGMFVWSGVDYYKNQCPENVAVASAILQQPLEYEAGYNQCVVRVDVNGVTLWFDPYDIINGVKP